MTQAIQKGVVALLAGLFYAAGIAVATEQEDPARQEAAASVAGTQAGSDAIVLAAGDPVPEESAPSEPMAEPDAEAGPVAEPEPQVPQENEKKVWLWLMVIVIVVAVVWLFSRNKPKVTK